MAPNQLIEKIGFKQRILIRCDSTEKQVMIIEYGRSDPVNGIISFNTPLAQAIFGKSKGDQVFFKVADKENEVEIFEILE